jgi:hypothetical protein
VIPEQAIRGEHAAFDPSQHPPSPRDVASVMRPLEQPHREQRASCRRDGVAVVVPLRVGPEDAAGTGMRLVTVPSPPDDAEQPCRACKSGSVMAHLPPAHELERDPFVVVVIDIPGPNSVRVRAVGAQVALETIDPPPRLTNVEAAKFRDRRHGNRRCKGLGVRPRRRCASACRRAVCVRPPVQELVPHRPERHCRPIGIRVALRRPDHRQRDEDHGRERERLTHVLTLTACRDVSRAPEWPESQTRSRVVARPQWPFVVVTVTVTVCVTVRVTVTVVGRPLLGAVPV